VEINGPCLSYPLIFSCWYDELVMVQFLNPYLFYFCTSKVIIKRILIQILPSKQNSTKAMNLKSNSVLSYNLLHFFANHINIVYFDVSLNSIAYINFSHKS